eukprot:gene5137-6203_t
MSALSRVASGLALLLFFLFAVAAASAPAAAAQCADGWSGVDSAACFKVFCDRLSRADAESVCVGDGGHLAEIDDEAQNAHVRSLAGEYNPTAIWIGGGSRNEGSRRSGSGAPRYSNWAPGASAE